MSLFAEEVDTPEWVDPPHGEGCRYKQGGYPCRQFSTDGTALGAQIAHAMGTTYESKIVRDATNFPIFVSDVDEEQADWENDGA